MLIMKVVFGSASGQIKRRHQLAQEKRNETFGLCLPVGSFRPPQKGRAQPNDDENRKWRISTTVASFWYLVIFCLRATLLVIIGPHSFIALVVSSYQWRMVASCKVMKRNDHWHRSQIRCVCPLRHIYTDISEIPNGLSIWVSNQESRARLMQTEMRKEEHRPTVSRTFTVAYFVFCGLQWTLLLPV